MQIDITNYKEEKIQTLIKEYKEREFITHIITTPTRTYLKIYNNTM